MYRKTYVVRSVRMIVDTTEEGGRRILADVLHDQVATARVVVNQSRHIVNEASDDDQRPLQRLLPDYIAE